MTRIQQLAKQFSMMQGLFQFLWAQECTVLDVRHQQVKH